MMHSRARPALLQQSIDASVSSGYGAGLDGISISTLRNRSSVEKQHRLSILKNVRERTFGKNGVITSKVRDATAAMHKRNRKIHRATAIKVKRATKEGGSVAMDLAANVVSPLSPVQAAQGLQQMKQAAALFHSDPGRQKEARKNALLGLLEVGGFAVGFSALTGPVGFIVVGALTLGVTTIKVANFVSNLFMKGRVTQEKDRLNIAVSKIAENRFIKPLVNTLLRLVYQMDTGIARGAKGLKGLFASTATKQEKALGLERLSDFHKLYSKYYPDAQTEKRETMSKFLADKKDSWNLHTLERDSKVIGGFTCFHLNDPKYGKQLYIEQLIPPFHKDALMNTATWDYIKKMAQDSGVKRIWLEIPASEKLPVDFKELDILYAQPTLTAKNTNPVGLNESKEDPMNVLRMTVLTLNSAAQGPTHNEFHKVIIPLVADWARKDDPAWIKLNKNPRNERVIPERAQTA